MDRDSHKVLRLQKMKLGFGSRQKLIFKLRKNNIWYPSRLFWILTDIVFSLMVLEKKEPYTFSGICWYCFQENLEGSIMGVRNLS